MSNANRFSNCVVCGRRLLANEEFPFNDCRVLQHRNCSKQRLVLELRERAESLGLTSLELLTRRLAKLQEGILQALGEVSFEQFQTAEPAGYLHLFFSGSNLKVRVVFRRQLQPEAIYYETLMTAGELQRQKTRLLLRLRQRIPTRAGSTHTVPTQRLLADWLIVTDWLKQAEDHWDGRKKEEIACEIMANERVQFKVLNSAGMDLELALRPFVPAANPELIAQQILSADDSERSRAATSSRDELVEAV